MIRPRPILWFERLLLLGLAIDLINNLAVWRAAVAAPASAGPAQSPGLILIAGVLPPAIGLLLWYLVARRASNVARWVTSILVMLGTIGFAVALARGGGEAQRAPFLVAAFAELLKLAAVGFLFMPAAASWFAGERAAP